MHAASAAAIPAEIARADWFIASLSAYAVDEADGLKLIARAYLARVGEEEPALRQQIVVHRCRE
jgi:hypothetical protein